MLDLEGKVDQVMGNTIKVFSGRTFSFEEIDLIKWTRNKYPKLSRSEFVKTICEFLEWKTPAGKYKVPQCGEFLNQLEQVELLVLPPKTKGGNSSKKIGFDKIAKHAEIRGFVRDFEHVRLEIARRGADLRRWRSYVNQFHMLGDKMVFGSRLYYFIKSGDIEFGCMQFSASAWALEARDNWIDWTVADRKARLNLIVNNSRYLIFPWINIKNLASKALSLAAKQIQDDWLKEYCYAPVLLETFVDIEHFKGTCYKAANWKYLGETKGRGRMDKNNEHTLPKKAIFMYPLQHDFKEVLKGERPCKSVNPDE